MTGAIRSRDVLFHPAVTIGCFGWRVFFKAAFSERDKPFLAVLQETNAFGTASSTATDMLARCIALEMQAKQIYTSLAQAFSQNESASKFFTVLAQQEQCHADLLEVCRAIAKNGGWHSSRFASWESSLSRLQPQLQSAADSLKQICSLEDALRLVLEIESSEINYVFWGAIAASDVAFVWKLKPFGKAIDSHIAYIGHHIPKLAPELRDESAALRAQYLAA